MLHVIAQTFPVVQQSSNSDMLMLVFVIGMMLERLIRAWKGEPQSNTSASQIASLSSQVIDLSKNNMSPAMQTHVLTKLDSVSSAIDRVVAADPTNTTRLG